MRRLFVVALSIAGLSAGCTTTTPSVSVSRICTPTADCTFDATCQLQSLGMPTVNSRPVNASAGDASNALMMFFEVLNQSPNDASTNSGGVNTHDFHIREARVTYSGISLPATAYHMQQLVPAGGTSVVAVVVLPASDYSASVPAGGSLQLTASVKLKGTFDDGSDFETAEFRIPVVICDGCVGAASCATGTPAYCPPVSGANAQPRNASCQ